MENAMKLASRNISDTRELTDKELNFIANAVGNVVRSQTLAVDGIIQANLKAEFASRRKQASKLLKSRNAA